MRVGESLPDQIGQRCPRQECGLKGLKLCLQVDLSFGSFCLLLLEKILAHRHRLEWWSDGPTHTGKSIVGLGKVQHEMSKRAVITRIITARTHADGLSGKIAEVCDDLLLCLLLSQVRRILDAEIKEATGHRFGEDVFLNPELINGRSVLVLQSGNRLNPAIQARSLLRRQRLAQ